MPVGLIDRLWSVIELMWYVFQRLKSAEEPVVVQQRLIKHSSEPPLLAMPEPRQQHQQIFILSGMEPDFATRLNSRHFVDCADIKECRA